MSREADGIVGIRVGGHSGFSGLVTCGSVWACPVCAAKIARKRADELQQVLTWATAEGHTVAMVTLTLRHHQRQRLAETWNGLTKAFGFMMAGGVWSSESEPEYTRRWTKWYMDRENGWRGSRRRECPTRGVGLTEAYGLLGWARAVEVTKGRNGWHPHIHMVVVLEGQTATDARVDALAQDLWLRWERGVTKQGLEAVRDGFDVRVGGAAASGLGAYLAKQLAFEATHGHAKVGRSGSRTPFEILADAVSTGDPADVAAWREWEEAAEGRRQLTWSKALKVLAGLVEKERTDQEVAEEDAGGQDAVRIEGTTWRGLRLRQPDVLDAADTGVSGLVQWLRDQGYGFTLTGFGCRSLGIPFSARAMWAVPALFWLPGPGEQRRLAGRSPQEPAA